MTLPPNTDGPEQTGDQGTPDPASGAPAAPQPPAPPVPPQAPPAPPAGSQPQAPQPPQQAPQAPQAPQQAPQAPQSAPQPPQQPQAAPQQYYGAPQGAPQYAAPGGPQSAPQYAPQAAAGGYVGDPGPGGVFDGATNPEDLNRPLYGATFGQAIRRFFKSYAKFDGRASRSEFWWAYLFQSIVMLVPVILLMIGLFAVVFSSTTYDYEYGYSAGPAAGSVALLVIGAILTGIISLALLVPSIAISWRRLHDANFPGTLWLINLAGYIPFLNYIGWIANIAFIVLAIMPSKPEGRRFDRA